VNQKRLWARWIAWGIHFYTALGLVAAAVIGIWIVDGSLVCLYSALAMMWVATVIDGTDGALARRFKVKDVLPEFDGRRLDDLTDFLTYTFLPLLFLWRSQILPDSWSLWILVPLLASAYGFCQLDAKTFDGYFLGFPSYWNVVVLYLFLLEPEPVVSLILILGFALLTFVPARYLYPTQPGRLNRFTLFFAAAWAIVLAWVFYRLLYPHVQPRPLPADLKLIVKFSLLFPAYYLIASWIVTWRR